MKGEKIGSEERKGKGDSLVLQTTSWRIGIALFFFQSLGCPTGQWSSKKSGPATEMEKGFSEVKGKFRAEPTQGGQLISAKRTEKIRGDKHAHG